MGSVVYAQTPAFKTTGNPLDNAAGELFTAELTQETMDYKDLNLNAKPTTLPASDISFTVSAEYGFSMLGTEPGNSAVTPGQTLTQGNYAVTNEGDTSDVYTIEAIYIQVGPSNWDVSLISTEGTINLANLSAGVLNTETRNVADDDDFKFHYVVTPDAGADDGEQITIYTTVETGATPVGEYTGGNALTYSGTSTATDDFTDQIASPELLISRVAAIDAPDTYESNGYGANDPVPGAVITYTYSYNNAGAAAAQDVILIAKVPTVEPVKGTNLAHVNGSGDRGNVELTPAAGNATGWTVSYTTEAAPNTDYGTAWTIIGTLDGTSATSFPADAGLYEGPQGGNDPEYAAKWIKWEKLSVAGAENATITWGVTIR
jgi:hypothetical protein